MKKIIFALIILLFSCQKKESLKMEHRWVLPFYEYYKDGSIKSIQETTKGINHGKTVEYYPRGNIKTIVNFPNDSTSVIVDYYESGEIKSSTRYRNGQKHGNYIKYDEKGNIFEQKSYYYDIQDEHELRYINGKLNQLFHYVSVGDSSCINQTLNFDDFGNIRKEMSSFYSVNYNPKIGDKIKIHQCGEVELYVSPPKIYERQYRHRVVIGEFDDDFNILDFKSLDTVFFSSVVFHVMSFSFDKPGLQWGRGIILYSYTDKDSNIQDEKMYFAIPFYVKEK